MAENRHTTYRISEAAREIGISAEWLRMGFLPPALRDRNGHRYYIEEDIERMRNRRSGGRQSRRLATTGMSVPSSMATTSRQDPLATPAAPRPP
jgi:MerR HTH family regulatory protein